MVCSCIWWCWLQGAWAVPCFCSLCSQLSRSGNGVFLIFLFLAHNLPQLCMHIFLVSYSFFVFCYSRRRLFRCKHCSTAGNGPRSQPVSCVYLDSDSQGPGVIHLGILQDARKVGGMVGTHIVTKIINVKYALLTKL